MYLVKQCGVLLIYFQKHGKPTLKNKTKTPHILNLEVFQNVAFKVRIFQDCSCAHTLLPIEGIACFCVYVLVSE